MRCGRRQCVYYFWSEWLAHKRYVATGKWTAELPKTFISHMADVQFCQIVFSYLFISRFASGIRNRLTGDRIESDQNAFTGDQRGALMNVCLLLLTVLCLWHWAHYFAILWASDRIRISYLSNVAEAEHHIGSCSIIPNNWPTHYTASMSIAWVWGAAADELNSLPGKNDPKMRCQVTARDQLVRSASLFVF